MFTTGTSLLAGPVATGSAYEATTGAWSEPASTKSNLTLPSGITASVTGSGLTSLLPTSTLGARGFNTSYFSPAGMVTGDTAALPSVETTPCASTGACPSLGSLIVEFSQPVRNPVIHLAGIGGTAPGAAFVQSDLHAVLDLTTPGVTLSKLAGTSSLLVTSTKISTTTDSVSSSCDTTQVSTGYLEAAGPAGCGSVQVNGTVTSVAFSMSAVFVRNLNAVNGPATSALGDAFALTVTLPQDFGDAPTSYHGSQAPAHIVSNLTLGAKIDEDRAAVRNSTSSPFAGASANGDDTDNIDDEDAFTNLPSVVAGVANTHSLTVPVSGLSKAGYLCGYLDLNKGGTFDTTAERACATLASGATSAVLTWSVPTSTTVGSTYSRFRLGYTQSQVQSPTGLADSGEVEDYPVTLAAAPTITLRKTTTGVASGPFTFALANTVQATGSVTTTTAGTAAQVDGSSAAGTQPFTISTIGTAVTITETALTGWQLSSATCVNGSGTTVGSLSGTTYTIPAGSVTAGATFTCDFTNGRIPPTITLRKTTTGVASGPFAFALANTVQTSGTVTTTTAGTAAQVDGGSAAGTQPFTISTIGTAVTITETALTGWQLSSATCVNGSGTTVGSLSGTTYTIPAGSVTAGATFTCDFTNHQVRQLTVTKQAANCDVGVPTCPLEGAQFALYAADPTLPGATPITNGIVADSPSSTFTSARLPVEVDYWLVETKAPDGFSLLTQPVKFRLSATQVNLDAAFSGTLIRASEFAITVTDLPSGALPTAGGWGLWPYLVVGAALFLGAGMLTLPWPVAATAAAGRRIKIWPARRRLRRSLRNPPHQFKG